MLAVHDAAGRRVATVGPCMEPDWAYHAEPGTDPLLRDLALALAADLGRLTG